MAAHRHARGGHDEACKQVPDAVEEGGEHSPLHEVGRDGHRHGAVEGEVQARQQHGQQEVEEAAYTCKRGVARGERRQMERKLVWVKRCTGKACVCVHANADWGLVVHELACRAEGMHSCKMGTIIEQPGPECHSMAEHCQTQGAAGR